MAGMKLTRRRILAASGALSAAFLGALCLGAARTRYYDGPPSDHWDGTQFHDPGGSKPKGLLDLLRWRTGPGKAQWPGWVPNAQEDHPPARVEGTRLRVSFVGHASVLLQTGGRNILLDPVWSERASPVDWAGPRRVRAPGIRFAALPPIDIVLVSHGHYDHLDLPTLSRLSAAHDPRILAPLGNDAIMRGHDGAIRAEGHDWGKRVDLGGGFAVTLERARHWSARTLWDRNKTLWAAFVLETPGGRIYFAGDTGYGGGRHFRAAREAYGSFRFAVLPIGAYAPRWFMRDQHMDPDEAVRAFRDLGAEWALGVHFGTFQLTDEAIDAPAQALAAALARAGVAPERFRALAPGETWDL